jgi:hypothetical protein
MMMWTAPPRRHQSAKAWSPERHKEGDRPRKSLSESVLISPRTIFRFTLWRAKMDMRRCCRAVVRAVARSGQGCQERRPRRRSRSSSRGASVRLCFAKDSVRARPSGTRGAPCGCGQAADRQWAESALLGHPSRLPFADHSIELCSTEPLVSSAGMRGAPPTPNSSPIFCPKPCRRRAAS